MNTILEDFYGSTVQISNNFYFGILALNFIDKRPYEDDIKLSAGITKNILPVATINDIKVDEIIEYENSLRRHLMNDIVIAYESYSMRMYASHQNGQTRIEPATLSDRSLGAYKFESLENIYSDDDRTFLTQLRRLRNSIVH